MGTEESRERRLHHMAADSMGDFHSSVVNTNQMSGKFEAMAMSSQSSFKSHSGVENFYGSSWDHVVSLNRGENFKGAPVLPLSEFANSHYPIGLENQPTMSSSSHMMHYAPDSGLISMLPKIPSLGTESLSDLVTSFGLPGSGQIPESSSNPNYGRDKEIAKEKPLKYDAYHSQEECQHSEEGGLGSLPSGKRKRTLESHSSLHSTKNAEGEQQNDASGESSGFSKDMEDQKQKAEKNVNTNLRCKQTNKQAKDSSNNGDQAKENYVHVRAKRGQATNSHSLAERVRRERISERMRLLQELVPGCNKITGKAVMLDEIINYVQSLQQQVEFLSMKLATVNPELNIDIERILSKEALHAQGSNAPILSMPPSASSSLPFQGLPHGPFPGIANVTPPPYHSLPQNAWDHELQALLQMGYDSNHSMNNVGANAGRSKMEL